MARYSPSGNFILRRFKENVVERRNQPNTTPSWKRSSTRGSKTTPDTLVTRKAVTSIQPSAPTKSLTVEGKTVTKRWLYHMLNYKRVLIDSFLWSIGGLTPRWHHREQYFAFLSQKKKIDSMLLGVCIAVINHRRRQNVVRKSVIHSAALCMPLSCVLTTLWSLWSVTVQTHSNMKSIY